MLCLWVRVAEHCSREPWHQEALTLASASSTPEAHTVEKKKVRKKERERERA